MVVQYCVDAIGVWLRAIVLDHSDDQCFFPFLHMFIVQVVMTIVDDHLCWLCSMVWMVWLVMLHLFRWP